MTSGESIDDWPSEKLLLAAADALYEGDAEFFAACEARWRRRFGGGERRTLREQIDAVWRERGWAPPPNAPPKNGPLSSSASAG